MPFAKTPDPPYYAVIFTAQRAAGGGGDGYDQMAERMVELAARQPGFLGVESVRGANGFGITVSYWASEEAIAAWKTHAEHAAAQEAGRRVWYADYEIRVAKVERAYGKADAIRQEPSKLEIRVDDLTGPDIRALLADHLRCCAEVSPPQSCHALNLDELRQPGVTFWSAWKNGELAGCGALKELDRDHGEIKSMRTAQPHPRKGVGGFILEHIIAEAKRRGYHRLSLETGSMDYFEPARRLYRRFGFNTCPPFAGYVEDPNSVFMTREITPSQPT